MAAALLDTGLLVRAYGADPKGKDAFERCAADRSALISVQSLAEFVSVCLERTNPPVPVAELLRAIWGMAAVFHVVSPGAGTVKAALLAVERHRMRFWDAMIWATAKENGMERILTGDLSAAEGREIEGVRFERLT